jgi:hypothetical protein
LPGGIPELSGLFAQSLHLGPDEIRLQPQDLLHICCTDQLLCQLELFGHILLGETHCLFSHIPRLFASGLGMTLERTYCSLGGGDEAVERLLGLVYAFFRKCPHILGYLELFWGSHMGFSCCGRRVDRRGLRSCNCGNSAQLGRREQAGRLFPRHETTVTPAVCMHLDRSMKIVEIPEFALPI